MNRLKQIPKSTLQNIAIFLLSILACLLLTQTQLSTVWTNAGTDVLTKLLGDDTVPAEATEIASPADIPILVKVVVTGAYGRYGNPHLISTDKAFTTFRTLLSEALGSAEEPKPCGESEFRSSLNETSVYFDFGEDFSLPILAGLMGTDMPDYDGTCCRLVLSAGPSTVTLWMINQDGEAQKSSTAVPPKTLRELTATYQLGNASFAFEMQDEFRLLFPYSLLLTELPQMLTLKARNAMTDKDHLLSQLQFNPHTNFRYTETGGTEVISEGKSTLRIEPDGTVLLQDGSDITLELSGGSDSPLSNVAVQTYQWLTEIMQGKLGDGKLALTQIKEDSQKTEPTRYHLRFSCLVDGVPVQFSNGDDIAAVTIQNGEVESCKIRFRTFEKTDQPSCLLPLPQVIAIAKQYPRRELMASYVDDGNSELDVSWLMQ